MDVVSGAASQIFFFFFFFPQNPADVDGDQLDVSDASLGSKLWRKFFFARAREFMVKFVFFSRTRCLFSVFFSDTIVPILFLYCLCIV